MLSYELAKQLKEAGFPNVLLQNTPDELINYNDCPECIPTLSEFIDACGDGYFKLEHTQCVWHAQMGLIEDVPFGMGKTPEEAVAKLWLKLSLAK